MKRVFLAVVMSVGSAFAATVPSPRNRQTLAAFRNAVRASLIAVLAAGLVPVGVSAALVYAPPEAINHVYWTSLNTSLAVAAPGLLSRHTGGHGLSTTVTATSTPGQGTLTPVVDPLGSFTYTPNTGFRGTDTFTYTITDPTSAAPQSSTATVTITVGTLVGLTFITAPDFFSLLGATPCNATVSSTFRFRASGTLTPPNGGNPGGPTFDETGTFTLDSANGPLSAFQATFTIRGTGQPDIVGTMALAALGSGGCTQTPFGLLSSVHFVVETSYSATGPLVETGFASTTIDAAGLDHGDTGNFWQGPFTLVAVAPGNTGIGAPVVSLDNVTVTFANVTVAGDTTLRRSVFGPQAPAGFAIAGGAIYYTVSTNAVFTGTAVVCITDYADIGYGRPNAALLHYNNPPPPIVGVDVTDYAKYPGGPTICSIPLTSLSPFVIAVPVTVAATQVITFGPLANKTFGDAPFSVSATASSGLTVSFTASGACTVTGSLVTITGAGACTITASQAGNANFNAATPVSQTFTVAVAVARPPFIIPAGSTASFTNVQFGACNSLSWGYQLDGGSNQVQATFPGGCGTGTAQDVTIGPFATDITLRVFLTDNVCAFTYYSDGTPVDHVIVEGSNPYSLRFADAGGFCERKTTTFNDFAGFNFRVDLAIRQVTKLTVNNSTGDFNDSATLSGTLQNSSGNPIVGATVTFTVSGQSCSGVTDATGSGSCAITPNEAAGSYTITGSYA
ncbi:MAG TPA: Ig-like domain-containing protein, partial [Candidatus Dormibacteraeota bacterium]|nr:Ig-like domain-containing protein [Candidatus Dormibacteraeota bacterium]